jgi:outer membrane protein assembly factor BamB
MACASGHPSKSHVDAKTGAAQWDVQTTLVIEPYTITGASRVVDGKVIIGNGSASDRKLRSPMGGDNLYPPSLAALHVRTGELA